MSTTTLDALPPRIPVDDRPTPAEFRSARGSDDLAELFHTVDVEDARRAHEARKILLIHRADELNTDARLIRAAIIGDAETELRQFLDNLAGTLDAVTEHVDALVHEMHQSGFGAIESGRFLDTAASGKATAHQLMALVAGPQGG